MRWIYELGLQQVAWFPSTSPTYLTVTKCVPIQAALPREELTAQGPQAQK